MDRGKKSRDGSRLTITRTIVRLGHESESELVYDNVDRPALAARPEAAPAAVALPETRPTKAEPEYVIETGTKILLALVSSVNTKRAAPGDRVYLETAVPVTANGRIVIPKGSYVSGTVTESERAGKVKGKASLYIRFDTLMLPNGVTRDFRSRVGGADVDWDRSEGRLKGEGSKGKDAGTVAKTTSAGAGIGSIAGAAAGSAGMGAGIGAAAGAAAGLIGVLASRGPDLILPKGSTLEMVLDRPLRFTPGELTTGSR